MAEYEYWSTKRLKNVISLIEDAEVKLSTMKQTDPILINLWKKYNMLEKEDKRLEKEKEELEEKRDKIKFLGMSESKYFCYGDWEVSDKFNELIKNEGFKMSYLTKRQIKEMAHILATKFEKNELKKLNKDINDKYKKSENIQNEQRKIENNINKREKQIKKELAGRYAKYVNEYYYLRSLRSELKKREEYDKEPKQRQYRKKKKISKEILLHRKEQINKERERFDNSEKKIYKTLIPIRKEMMKEILIDEL